MGKDILYYLKFLLSAAIAMGFLFLLTKLMGKRQISQMSLFDYINGITIGSIAAEAAVSGFNKILEPLIAMAFFALAAAGISLASNKSIKLRRLFVGKPVLLYENGKLYEKNLLSAKLDLNELMTGLRIQGYFDLEELSSVYLETNGALSVLPLAADKPATPSELGVKVEKASALHNVVLDGVVMEDCLRDLGRNKVWLFNELRKRGEKLPDILLATSDGSALNLYLRTGERMVRDIFI